MHTALATPNRELPFDRPIGFATYRPAMPRAWSAMSDGLERL
jgi:hypothetical protein